MKKLFYSFAILMALVGCSEDPATGGNENGGEEPAPETAVTFTATLEAIGEEELAWPEGDAISVFRSVANEKFVYNATNAKFEKADNSNPTAKTPYFYGIHPYSTISSSVSSAGKVTTSIPSQQNYVAGSFNFAQLPMVAVAEKDATELEFKNLCGFLCVKIYGNAGIKSVEIKGNNNESLAGSVAFELAAGETPSVSMGTMGAKDITLKMDGVEPLGATAEEAKEFWFIVPPTTFSNGLSIAVVDEYDHILRKNYSGEIVIARNEVTALTEVMEIKAKIPAKVIFDAQFNLDGTVTDKGIFGLTVETKKNEAGETPNMLVYTHPDFEGNNIAHFNFMAHNEMRNHSYFELNYENNEEFKAALEGGLSFEIVTAPIIGIYDWWQCPAATNTFRFYHNCEANGNQWIAGYNGPEWWPWDAGGKTFTTSSTTVLSQYQHSVYVYDPNMQAIYTYTNGKKDGEQAEVIDFLTGKRLTIGGYPHQDGGLAMAYNGDVALVKIYDQALSEEEVAEKYAALSLPEAPVAPEAAAISEPLFDLKWADDRTATDEGSAALEVNPVLNDLTEIVNVPGFGNVVNFAVKPNDGNWASPDPTVVSNSDYSDGFYRIEYTDNEEFKNKLRDGFTLEVICASNFRQGGFWMRPFSTDRWGFMMHDDKYRWKTVANGGENSWGAHGDSEKGYPAYTDEAEGAPMKSFTHILYVYNAEGKEYGMFVDGKCCAARPLNGFEVGTMMSVPGMPYTDRLQMAHGWNGKVAAVRIYDEAFTQAQRVKRYNDMKPVIETLNTLIAQ